MAYRDKNGLWRTVGDGKVLTGVIGIIQEENHAATPVPVRAAAIPVPPEGPPTQVVWPPSKKAVPPTRSQRCSQRTSRRIPSGLVFCGVMLRDVCVDALRSRNEWWSQPDRKLFRKQAGSAEIPVVLNPQPRARNGEIRSWKNVLTDFALNSSAKQQALERVNLGTFR